MAHLFRISCLVLFIPGLSVCLCLGSIFTSVSLNVLWGIFFLFFHNDVIKRQIQVSPSVRDKTRTSNFIIVYSIQKNLFLLIASVVVTNKSCVFWKNYYSMWSWKRNEKGKEHLSGLRQQDFSPSAFVSQQQLNLWQKTNRRCKVLLENRNICQSFSGKTQKMHCDICILR